MEKGSQQLKVGTDRQEIKEHGSFDFPVRISDEKLFAMYGGAFLWHWHPQIELTLVLEGQIRYKVNDRTYHLRAGDGLFCNCNALHMGESIAGRDCSYVSVTFLPRVLYGEKTSAMYTRYVRDLCRDNACPAIVLRPETEWQRKILQILKQIHAQGNSRSQTWELEVQIGLLQIWLQLYENWPGSGKQEKKETDPNQERIRILMSYIQEHYAEKLTLENLADQIHICKNECCRMFKRYMQETLFSYLMAYRVNQSLILLAESDLEITEIAEQCGFANPGYYTRVFKRYKDMTPMAYRKHCRQNAGIRGGGGETAVV